MYHAACQKSRGYPATPALTGISTRSCDRGARVRHAATWLALLLGLAIGGCSRSTPPRLLVLLTVDTLRADRVGAFGSERGLTPRLDALAAESSVFGAAYGMLVVGVIMLTAFGFTAIRAAPR